MIIIAFDYLIYIYVAIFRINLLIIENYSHQQVTYVFVIFVQIANDYILNQSFVFMLISV